VFLSRVVMPLQAPSDKLKAINPKVCVKREFMVCSSAWRRAASG